MASTAAFNIRPVSEDLVLSVDELKKIFLFGVDLTDVDGNPFPEEMYTFHIRSASEWIQKELGGLLLCPTTITNEAHDYRMEDYQSFSFLKLRYCPVLSVEQVSVLFPLSTTPIVFDPSWYSTESVGAQVNLIPTSGTFSQILLSQSGCYLPLLNGSSYFPNIFRVSYTAGFQKGSIPFLIKEIVGMKAALGPFNTAGDLIAGAGIASKSLSIDGLSESISTTSSPSFSGYGARILNYNKEIDRKMKSLREYYCGINMSVA